MSILVVGGSKGIGRATCLRFAPGNDVFVNCHSDIAAGEATVAAVVDAGGRGHLVVGDVGTPDGAAQVLEKVAAHTGALDQLVHCAVDPLSAPLLEVDLDDFARSVHVSGLSLLYVVRAATDLLHAGSSVFFLSSLGSKRVVPGYGAIGSSKALAESLVRYLAVELAPRGVRVNTVSSGPLDTDAYRSAFANAAERLAVAARNNPSHRPLTTDDVAALISLLASADAGLVQGQEVRVDGGLYL
jgi:NAD(P)-dependent dehydrogenase (short-subunit alcohol dehydrogenase family)